MAHRTGTAPGPLVVPGARRTAPRRVRLVSEPVFILSYMRSGSTLLRVVLDSHSQICAPLEMHLRSLRVTPGVRLAESALNELGLTTRDLENMLWDRVLYDRLLHSKKSVIVDKTPSNVNAWRRIHRYWPKAKFVLLYRHPVRIMDSWHGARPNLPREKSAAELQRYTELMQHAQQVHGGLVVRYEEFTRRPAAITKEICDYIGVPWEPQMIEYGTKDHGRFVRGLGDWTEKINSGQIKPAPADPLPEEIPPELKESARLMGYI
jgi:hypothetical protein